MKRGLSSTAAARRTTSRSTRPGARSTTAPTATTWAAPRCRPRCSPTRSRAEDFASPTSSYPVKEPRRIDASSPSLVERSEWQGHRRSRPARRDNGDLARPPARRRGGLHRARRRGPPDRGKLVLPCPPPAARLLELQRARLRLRAPGQESANAQVLQGQPPARRRARRADPSAARAGHGAPSRTASPSSFQASRSRDRPPTAPASTSSGPIGSSSTSFPTATWSSRRRCLMPASGWSPR